MSIQKKDRTLEITVDDLLSSPRFKIAINYYDFCPELLRNLFLEVGEESQQVAKNVIISEYNMFGSKKERVVKKEDGSSETEKVSGLDQFELTPYLRGIKTFARYNVWWKITEGLERDIYMADPTFQLDKHGRKQLIVKLKGSL